jgi:hypothetical protein
MNLPLCRIPLRSPFFPDPLLHSSYRVIVWSADPIIAGSQRTNDIYIDWGTPELARFFPGVISLDISSVDVDYYNPLRRADFHFSDT